MDTTLDDRDAPEGMKVDPLFGHLVPEDWEFFPEAVHRWFNLTYSSYLVLPRVCMQSMPDEWQNRMVKCLQEFEDAFEYLKLPTYRVQPIDDNGKFIKETLPPYRRGHVEPKPSVNS